MRGLLIRNTQFATWLCVFTMGWMVPSIVHAGQSLMSLVVLPFEATGAKQYELPDAIELELELVDSVIVKSNKRVWAALRKRKDARFAPKTIRQVCKRRDCDILIRGVEGWSKDGNEALHIVAYARDGTARYWSIHDRDDNVDALAAEVAKKLAKALRRWSRLKPIKVVFPDAPGYRDAEPISDEDLFVEVAPKRKAEKRVERKLPEEEPLALDDLFAVDRPPKKRDPSKRRRIAGTAGPSRSEKTEKKREAERREKKRRKRDEADARRRREQGDSYDDGRDSKEDEGHQRRKERKRMAEPEEEDDSERETDPRLSHLVLVGAGVDIGTWYYAFQANRPDQDAGFWNPAFPGLRVHGSLWPIEWVGVDVDARAMWVPFETEDPTAPIVPKKFSVYQISAGGALNGRYIMHLGAFGLGAGGRIGYRYLGALVEPQTHSGDSLLYTVVPGYHFHALSVGGHFFASAIFLERRLEIEVDADLLPATTYSETPDNPGSGQLAFGWNVEGKIRFDLIYGIFAEGSIYTAGLYNSYMGTGDRLSGNYGDDGTRTLVQGGNVWNAAGGASLGVGFFW